MGLHVDKHLSWSFHIEHIRKKIKSYAFLIRQLTKTCSVEAAKTTYYGHVHSSIAYGIIFWGARPEAIKVFRLQKRCIRNIVGAGFRDSCKPIFDSLKILTLPSLYILEAASFVKQNYTYFADQQNCHQYNTRNKSELYIPSCNYASSRKGVFIQLMKVYNQVPENIRKLSLAKFKPELKKLLLEKRIYKLTLDESML